jgi:hypothetical protein
MNSTLNNLYDDEQNTNPITESLNKTSTAGSVVDNLPKMSDIRKTLKVEVDKSPILKYIVGSNANDGNIRRISSSNPLKTFDDSYRSKGDWYTNLGGETGVVTFRQTLGNLI